MGAFRRLQRRLSRRAARRLAGLPRRGRRAVALLAAAVRAGRAVQLSGAGRHEPALRQWDAAARRDPSDQEVARARAALLSRTGRVSAALAASSRLAAGSAKPPHRRLQRTVAGRFAETDPAWQPSVPGLFDAATARPGRVLYLAKESMPHHNNGYCTRTHETLLAVREAGRDPVAVTLPGFPAPIGDRAPEPVSVVDGIEYRHVLPGAAGLLSGLTAEEQVQLATTRFAAVLRDVRPEVVHAGSGHRGFDLALPGLALSRWAGVPWVYEVRSFFETTWTAETRYAEHAEHYHRRFATETRAMRAADVVVTLSGPMRDEIVHRHGVPADSVVVVPNAVDLDRFGPALRDAERRRRLGLEGTFVLGYVSNLDHHREGQEVLLDAAARLRGLGHPVSVLLVGEGRRRVELQRRASDLGIAEVCVFTGSVPFAEVPALYAQIDLFVVPRVDERAARMVSPMKPFEAMAMRVPVLVSDLPALREIAGDAEQRAFVFPAGSAPALAARVESLIAAPAARAARAEAAGIWVAAERTWAANGKAFDAAYTLAAERFSARAAERATARVAPC